MKSFFKFLDVIFTIIIVVWYAVEILAIPALFVVIGVLNNYPWQYYAITIGGFFLLFAIIDIVCYFYLKPLKRNTPRFLKEYFIDFLIDFLVEKAIIRIHFFDFLIIKHKNLSLKAFAPP